MKIVFAGTPEFAAVALRHLIAAGVDIPLVLTQPDRPAGRGQKLVASPVKQVALAHGMTVHQPATLRDAATHAPLRDCAPDVLLVAAYGLILPQAVLDIPRRGCLNIHASLLPRWRGAAPIQRCIEAGDSTTGITIMQMAAGLDSGPLLLAEALNVGAGETAATLHDRLASLGARLSVTALQQLDTLQPTPQPAVGVTYASKINKAEAAIDWRQPAAVIERRIRAFDPFPGCTAQLDETVVKIWRAVMLEAADGVGKGDATNSAAAPGTILAVSPQGITVACGTGALRLIELQKPGGRRLASADFLCGLPLVVGQHFALAMPPENA